MNEKTQQKFDAALEAGATIDELRALLVEAGIEWNMSDTLPGDFFETTE